LVALADIKIRQILNLAGRALHLNEIIAGNS
jgi:hypothetical protein